MNTLGVKRNKINRTLGSKLVGGALSLGHKFTVPVVKSVLSGSVLPIVESVVSGIVNSANSVHSQNMPMGLARIEKKRKSR